MRLLIDTSVAIALRDGEPGLLARRAGSVDFAAISVITAVELEGGVGRSDAGRRQRRAALDAIYDLFEVLPFDEGEARAYGEIVGETGFTRSKVPDRMIAATAIVARLPLATLNEKDFRDVPNLQLIDWSE